MFATSFLLVRCSQVGFTSEGSDSGTDRMFSTQKPNKKKHDSLSVYEANGIDNDKTTLMLVVACTRCMALAAACVVACSCVHAAGTTRRTSTYV